MGKKKEIKELIEREFVDNQFQKIANLILNKIKKSEDFKKSIGDPELATTEINALKNLKEIITNALFDSLDTNLKEIFEILYYEGKFAEKEIIAKINKSVSDLLKEEVFKDYINTWVFWESKWNLRGMNLHLIPSLGTIIFNTLLLFYKLDVQLASSQMIRETGIAFKSGVYHIKNKLELISK